MDEGVVLPQGLMGCLGREGRVSSTCHHQVPEEGTTTTSDLTSETPGTPFTTSSRTFLYSWELVHPVIRAIPFSGTSTWNWAGLRLFSKSAASTLATSCDRSLGITAFPSLGLGEHPQLAQSSSLRLCAWPFPTCGKRYSSHLAKADSTALATKSGFSISTICPAPSIHLSSDSGMYWARNVEYFGGVRASSVPQMTNDGQ